MPAATAAGCSFPSATYHTPMKIAGHHSVKVYHGAPAQDDDPTHSLTHTWMVTAMYTDGQRQTGRQTDRQTGRQTDGQRQTSVRADPQGIQPGKSTLEPGGTGVSSVWRTHMQPHEPWRTAATGGTEAARRSALQTIDPAPKIRH
eukprot:COSAG06_NODE_3361_length_5453_cov_8.336758_2_plen_145_part_00